MTVSPTRIVRRINWTGNKRSLGSSSKVAKADLDEVQELHAAGSYEEALEQLKFLDGSNEDPRALRLKGLCELGMRNFADAVDAFDAAQAIHLFEIAKDDVNKATTHLAAGDYTAAMNAVENARQIAPSHPAVHICRLSVANRSKDAKALRDAIGDLVGNHADIIKDPLFLERLDKDTDLIGVSDLIADLKGA